MKITVASKKIEITHPEKIVFPRDGITKADVISYYAEIAPVMFPYIKNHLLIMQRLLQDIDHEGFFHKDAPDHFPAWIKRMPLINKEDKELVHYVVASSSATCVYLAQFGCLTPHAWMSRYDAVEKPDMMMFDLDPHDVAFGEVRKVALKLHELLDTYGLISFVKTTGQKGLHVVIPLKRFYTFETVREYAQMIAQEMVNRYPELCTVEMRKEKRGKRVFIDTLRNAYGATAVTPYAIRPQEGAPVAAPINWDEVGDAKLSSNRYTMKTIFKRLEKKGDPWVKFHESRNRLLI